MKEDIETLKQKLAQKERELEIILAIDRIRDGTTEMQELLSSIVQVVTHYLDADLCLMSLVREESGELELKTVDDRRGIFGQLSRDALRKAAEQGTAIDHVSILNDTFGLHQQGVNHLLAAPLVIGGERLGSLLLLNKQRGFDQDDIDLLEAVVSQTDSAVVHVRTYRQLQQRNKELETIYRIDRIRDSGLEFQPMLNVALNELCQVITAEVGFIMLFDETGQQLELKASTESDIFAIAEYYRLVQETANESLWKAKLINRRDLDSRIRSIICIPLILRDTIIGIFGAINGPNLRAFDNEDELLLTAIASQMDTAIFESLEKRKLRSAFERSVGPQIMEAILASGRDFLKGERSQVTVLFSDMRGFTSIAERTEAESLVTILHEHLEAMTSIIMEYEGTLDKFMGDEVMALFGAPLPLEDHALRAVRTALEMQRAHKELMTRWEAAGQEAVPIGIGINSGDMIVGQIGSSKFTDYTVIGDNVNLGSRLCGVAKGHQILISETTYQLVHRAVKVNKPAPIQVKGRVQPVQTYEVIGLNRSFPTNSRRSIMLPQFSISPARRNRLILIVLLLLLVCWMLYVAKSALLPYIMGLVVAYLVLPVVHFLDHRMPSRLRDRNLSRPLSILIVYLMVILLVAGIFAFLIPPVVQQGEVLWKQMPQLAAKGRDLAAEWLGRYEEAIPLDIQQRIQSNLEKLAGTIGQAVQEGSVRTVSFISSTVGFFLGVLVIPFWLFYILNDEAKVRESALDLIPDRIEPDLLNILRITDDVFSAYIRGQLLLCLFIGTLATIGLLIVGVDFALLLGLIAGAFEILPFVGPILGAIPALIVAALQSPMTALWTLVVFIIIQQIENLFLVPRIAGESVKLHPALIMVVLVVGGEALGLWGMLLAVPLTAVIRDVFKYLYLRFSDEGVSPGEAMARVRTEKMIIEV